MADLKQYLSNSNYRDMSAFTILPEQLAKIIIFGSINFCIDTIGSIGEMDIEGLLGGSNIHKLTIKEVSFSLMVR